MAINPCSVAYRGLAAAITLLSLSCLALWGVACRSQSPTVPPISPTIPAADRDQSLASSQLSSTTSTLSTPIVSGTFNSLDVFSWSPDGRWLAYVITQEVTETQQYAVRRTLNFKNVESGQQCAMEPVIVSEWTAPQLVWQKDELAVVGQNGQLRQGVPCQQMAIVAQTPTPTAQAIGPHHISPNGRFQARTEPVSTSMELNVEYSVTTLSHLGDPTPLVTVPWSIDVRLGDADPSLSGEWLPGDQFLIYETIGRGPLLVNPSGIVTEVTTALFKTILPKEEGQLSTAAVTSILAKGERNYHLLWAGHTPAAGPLRLYHSEDGMTEELPSNFEFAMATPDGQWLILTDGQASYVADRLWLRRVDPTGSPLRIIPGSRSTNSWTQDWTKVAFGDMAGQISAISFPELEPLGRWTTPAYEVGSLTWTSDGTRLAIQGDRSVGDEFQRAIFVVLDTHPR